MLASPSLGDEIKERYWWFEKREAVPNILAHVCRVTYYIHASGLVFVA